MSIRHQKYLRENFDEREAFLVANKYNGGLNDGVAIFWNTQKLPTIIDSLSLRNDYYTQERCVDLLQLLLIFLLS